MANTTTAQVSFLAEYYDRLLLDNLYPDLYLWQFGDGNTSTLANPSHQYTGTPGVAEVKTVTLTVTDDGGANPDESDATTLKIFLNNDAPSVIIDLNERTLTIHDRRNGSTTQTFSELIDQE